MRHLKMLCCISVVMILFAGHAIAIEKIAPDPAAVELLNAFLAALSTPQEPAREAAVIPYVHKSLLGKDGKLAPNVRSFSYKKASNGVQFYKVPAEITEVHKGNILTVGFKETAEKGRKDKYFINKINRANGRPAPVIIFFPEGGGSPKVLDFGSL